MRRGIAIFQDNVSGRYVEKGGPGTFKNYFELRKKADLTTGLNTLADAKSYNVEAVDPGEIAYLSGGTGAPVFGRVVPPDSLVVTGFFSSTWVLPSLFVIEPEYNSLERGDGADNAAQRAVAGRKGGKGGTQTITVELYLALLVMTYQSERKYQAQADAAAILHQLLAKKITPDEALALATKLPKT